MSEPDVAQILAAAWDRPLWIQDPGTTARHPMQIEATALKVANGFVYVVFLREGRVVAMLTLTPEGAAEFGTSVLNAGKGCE